MDGSSGGILGGGERCLLMQSLMEDEDGMEEVEAPFVDGVLEGALGALGDEHLGCGDGVCNNPQFQVNFHFRKISLFIIVVFTIHFYYSLSLFISKIFISYSRKLNYCNTPTR